jgi:hypothetical protein
LGNKTLRNKRVGSPRVKQNYCRYAINRKHTNDDLWVLLGFVYGEVANLPLDGLLARIWSHVVDLQLKWSIGLAALGALSSVMPGLPTRKT